VRRQEDKPVSSSNPHSWAKDVLAENEPCQLACEVDVECPNIQNTGVHRDFSDK